MDLRSYLISRGITPRGETIDFLSHESDGQEPSSGSTNLNRGKNQRGGNQWDLTEIEDFIKNNPITGNPVKVSSCCTITDPVRFIESHNAIVKAQNGNETYKPYYERLIEFIHIQNKSLVKCR